MGQLFSIHAIRMRNLLRRCLADFKGARGTYDSVRPRSFVENNWDLGWRKPEWPKFAESLNPLAKTLANFKTRSVSPFYGLFSSYVYIKYGIVGGGNHGPTFVADWVIKLYGLVPIIWLCRVAIGAFMRTMYWPAHSLHYNTRVVQKNTALAWSKYSIQTCIQYTV